MDGDTVDQLLTVDALLLAETFLAFFFSGAFAAFLQAEELVAVGRAGHGGGDGRGAAQRERPGRRGRPRAGHGQPRGVSRGRVR